MGVTVKFYDSVKKHTNCDSICFEQIESLHQLIAQMGGHFGEAFVIYLMADETCFMLINGKSIMATGGLKSPLKDGDMVEILPVVGAG
ncbi:MAG: MoaD/ThiS family protein [Lachnospiraceae bacterium]|nr:MoaD/ThiS family protein [Lachnospiraceae bacterium]